MVVLCLSSPLNHEYVQGILWYMLARSHCQDALHRHALILASISSALAHKKTGNEKETKDGDGMKAGGLLFIYIVFFLHGIHHQDQW